jgi:hypothetical protein
LSVIPDALRSIEPSSTIGNLSWTPSSGSVTYYEARVYAEGTTNPVLATKYLGKPEAAANGFITTTIRTTLNALSAGNYEVTIAAVGPGGTSESAHGSAYAVPLAAA